MNGFNILNHSKKENKKPDVQRNTQGESTKTGFSLTDERPD